MKPSLRIDVVTLFPEAVRAALAYGVVGRALERGLLQLACFNPRDHATDAYRSVDDRPYGGGPGMVLMLGPTRAAVNAARAADPRPVRVSYLSPQGPRLTQARVRALAARERLLLLCGRYEGVDERLLTSVVDEELSIGDYVLSGGEPAALVLIDAVVRLLPGALHHAESARQDSFEDGLLDCPHYTRPEQAPEGEVPAVLRSGNHRAIARWRRQQALGRTWLKRPDLLARLDLSDADRALLAEFMADYSSTAGVHSRTGF